MSNLQDLMSLVIGSTSPSNLFSVRVTPTVGSARLLTIKTKKDVNRIRQTVQKAAAREYPHGFSFSVRPM